MEIFRSDDGSVAKFIHDDFSETAIKCVPSQSTFRDSDTGHIETRFTDRNKWSLFVSSSTGCFMKCRFCHLTEKNSRFIKLSSQQIYDNLVEATKAELQARPELSQRWLKMSWMGMGDALANPGAVREVTLPYLDWLFSHGYSQGLDGVDISTVLPQVGDKWVRMLADLNTELTAYPSNPRNQNIEQAELATSISYRHRSPLRLFYSLHSAIQETRDYMIPHAMPLREAIPLLQDFQGDHDRTLILHQLFIQGLNGSPAEAKAVVDFVLAHFPLSELRVLRYNHCDRSAYMEWPGLDDTLPWLAQKLPLLKVQQSAGKEVAAACGQFLVAAPKPIQESVVC